LWIFFSERLLSFAQEDITFVAVQREEAMADSLKINQYSVEVVRSNTKVTHTTPFFLPLFTCKLIT